ncbi:MAG: RAMP superfamily CRISPR-associated protein, partial [Promethearchaeota archaeon]
TLLEPLHIRGERGLPLSKIDNPSFKINEKPLIPGSTIKGVLRAYLTRLINSIDDSALSSLKLRKRDSFDEKEFQQEKDFDKKIKMIENLGSVDKLFGVSGLAAPLIITNAIIQTQLPNPTIVRPHIKINLNTDIASKLGPFFIEAVPQHKDIKFKFQMIFEEPVDEIYADAILLFNKLKNMMDLGTSGSGLELFIGGMKSRGYGHVKIKVVNESKYSILDLIKG